MNYTHTLITVEPGEAEGSAHLYCVGVGTLDAEGYLLASNGLQTFDGSRDHRDYHERYVLHRGKGRRTLALEGTDYYARAFGSPENRAEVFAIALDKGEWLAGDEPAGPAQGSEDLGPRCPRCGETDLDALELDQDDEGASCLSCGADFPAHEALSAGKDPALRIALQVIRTGSATLGDLDALEAAGRRLGFNRDERPGAVASLARQVRDRSVAVAA